MDNRTYVLLASMMAGRKNPFVQVDYLEGYGQQYIDTGISAPNGFLVRTKVEFVDAETEYYLCGSMGNLSNNAVHLIDIGGIYICSLAQWVVEKDMFLMIFMMLIQFMN